MLMNSHCARAAPTPFGDATAHFLRETGWDIGCAMLGLQDKVTVRADSGFYAHALVVVCRKMDVRLLHHHPPTRPPQGVD